MMVENRKEESADPVESRSGSKVIAEVYQVHLEEFKFLWWQRDAAMKSPDYFADDIKQLDDRLKAHMDGLLVPGPAAIPMLQMSLLEAEESEAAFAAAWVLLSLEYPAATDVVIEALLEANELQLDGICQAICQVPRDRALDRLKNEFTDTSSTIAVIADEVLAFHRELAPAADRVSMLLKDESPWVRRHAWRIIALSGKMPPDP